MTPSSHRPDQVRRERARATRETLIHITWVAAVCFILFLTVHK